MEPLDILSDAVIDTLKEFSTGKRLLTPASLKAALLAKEEVTSLFSPAFEAATNESRTGASSSMMEKAPASQTESEVKMNQNIESLHGFRNAFLKILDNLAPVIRGAYETRFCELQQKIDNSNSSQILSMLGEQIGQMLGELINEAVERMQFSNDFLVELSKDLHKMEENLSSYQTYNTESHQISSDFNDDLLSHTDDMHRAIDSSENLYHIRNLIVTKLDVISRSIETKRHSDELRLRDADTRITELQNNLKTYEIEILQVKERSVSLEKEVLLDELTRINNRRAYDLQIRENLRHYHRSGEPFSVILIDIDHFKKVNDNYGHKAGDKCLKEVASIIRSSLRQSDFLARYGGEELIAIVKGSNIENARNIAEKIRSRVEKTNFHFQGEKIPITISLGVTEIMPSDTETDTPFMRVDEAMYQAKKNGRNRVNVNT